MLTTLALAAGPAGHGFAGPGFGLIFLIAFPLFFLGLMVLFGVLARRRFARGGWAVAGHGASASSNAEATLAERFAQGDIDEVDYRARLEVLRTVNATPPTKK